MSDAQSSSKPVFVSYSSNDRAFVEKLTADLRARGVNIWIDQTGLKAGTPDWEQALRDAIRQSRAVLLIASRSARLSRYVKDEIRIAQMYGRPLYPVWAVGDEWIDCIPMGLGGMQFIDARADSYAAALDEIVGALAGAAPMDAAPAETEPPLPDDFVPRNPYKGLRAFRRDDAGDFFGRETFVTELVESVRAMITEAQAARLLVVLLGPSGSGKSSVIMAGLLPRLQAGVLPGSQDWRYLDPLVPGDHPLERLTLALAGALPERSLASLREDLEDDAARGLHLLAGRIAGAGERRAVLMVDQFEELFTLTRDEDERRRFIDLLVNAASEPRGQCIVLVTLRADFYDRPLKYPALGKLLEECSRALLPMDVTDLRHAIEKPAALPDVRLTFDDGLVGDLLFEVRGEPAPLPLLQFALDQLFQRREGRHLTRAAYTQIGGVRGALARHAEQIYLGLPSDEHRRMARGLFLRLIEPGATEQDTTRRRAALTELDLPDAEGTRLLRETADTFINARLLVASRAGAVDTLEVGHEALIAVWERLAAWLKDARDDIRRQQQVNADSGDWVRRGRRADDDGLYRGALLIDAQAWAGRNLPSADEQAFIQASAARQAQVIAAEEARIAELKRATQGARRARRLLTVVGAAAALLIASALLTVTQARQQVADAEQTLTPVPLTIDAAGALVGTAQYDAALARGEVSDAQAALLNAQFELDSARQRQQLAATDAAVASTQVGIAGSTLTPIPPTLTALAGQVQQQSDFTYSLRLASLARDLNESSNSRLAQLALPVALAANQVAVPPIESRRTLAELAYAPGIRRMFDYGFYTTLAPDGRTVFSLDGILRDMLTGEVLLELEDVGGVPPDGFAEVAFSPDMRYIAASVSWLANNPAVYVWDGLTGELLYTLNKHTDRVTTLAFSPNGRLLATGGGVRDADGRTGEIFLWDAATGAPRGSFEGHTREVSDLAFTPDGTLLLSGAGDYDLIEIFLWDIATTAKVREYPGHITSGVLGEFVSLDISSDGLTFLSGSGDKIIWWNLETGEQLRVESEPGYHVIFSPDGRTFAYTESGILTIRAVGTGELRYRSPRYFDYLYDIAYTPDGQHIFTRTASMPILWDINQGTFEREYTDSLFGLRRVAFSPDGRRVLSASQDGAINVWDTLTGDWLLAVPHGGALPNDIAVSPDGHLAASADWGGNIYLWEFATGVAVHTLFSPNPDGDISNEVFAIAFSPDGRTLATVGRNSLVSLWNVETGNLDVMLQGHADSLFGTTSVAFSHDGRYIASGGSDLQVILWDAASGQVIHTFSGHSRCLNDEIEALAFSPDDRRLYSAGCDRLIIEWDVESGARLRTLVGHTTEELRSLDISPDGRYALSSDGYGAGRAIYWDLESGLPLYVFDGMLSALSPDGRYAAVGLFIGGGVQPGLPTAGSPAQGGFAVRLIRLDSQEQLLQWTQANRVIWPPTCDEILALGLRQPCNE